MILWIYDIWRIKGDYAWKKSSYFGEKKDFLLKRVKIDVINVKKILTEINIWGYTYQYSFDMCDKSNDMDANLGTHLRWIYVYPLMSILVKNFFT